MNAANSGPAMRWIVRLLAVVAVLAAGGSRAEELPGFSGDRAFAHLEAVCRLGPRPSGSAAMERQREMLVAHFRAAGATVSGQGFQIRDRRSGQPVRMENLVVEWHPARRERVLIGAHYDTRPFPDRDPVDPRGTVIGANDGASGVAVLMELAAAMPSIGGDVGVDFVLVWKWANAQHAVLALQPDFQMVWHVISH